MRTIIIKRKPILNSWKIITPIKEQQRVVALDEKTNKLVHLKMNHWVQTSQWLMKLASIFVIA